MVTRGLRNTIGNQAFASALTFEIMTNSDGGLEIARSDWTYAHS